MSKSTEQSSAGARNARIILGIMATAVLVFMGVMVVRALRTTRNNMPVASPSKRLAANSGSAIDPASMRTLAGEHFTVGFSSRTDKADAAAVMRILDTARQDLARRLSPAQLSLDGIPQLEVILHESTGDFTAQTGQPWWAAAATKGSRIEMQPIEVLRNRGVFESTLRHEYTHAVIESLGHGATPRWLAEGMAITVAGEGRNLSRYAPKEVWTTDEIDRRLAALANGPSTADEMRAVYAAAYRAVQLLIKEKTEAGVWRLIASGE